MDYATLQQLEALEGTTLNVTTYNAYSRPTIEMEAVALSQFGMERVSGSLLFDGGVWVSQSACPSHESAVFELLNFEVK